MKLLKKIIFILLISSCANIVSPTGGDKDIDPPKILNIQTIEKSKNMKCEVIKFEFNEHIQVNKWQEYFYISPPIKKRAQKKIKGNVLFLTIEDTLNNNITYNFALNRCIKDNNEGNILDTLNYLFTRKETTDTHNISGSLQDSYTLNALENAWVMLFNENLNDTVIFKNTPNYIAKTNKNGFFNFPNLKTMNYKIVALTGFDFVYNKDEKIAFSNNIINAKTDSFISLFAFDPIIKIDSLTQKSAPLKSDSIITNDTNTIIQEKEFSTGKLKINTKNSSCIFQLLQDEKVIIQICFSETPYLIEGIVAGNYNLKYISDNNNDSVWSTGSWERRIQPEKVIDYPSEIKIRSNWDLEVDWVIED